MATARVILIAAMATGFLGGCGTVCNFASGDPAVYGGVVKDLEVVRSPLNVSPQSDSSSGGPALAVLAGVVCADIAVSAVADTLTLPLTIYLRQNDPPPPASEDHRNINDPGQTAPPPTGQHG
jgi:uncharacterized protein YceK